MMIDSQKEVSKLIHHRVTSPSKKQNVPTLLMTNSTPLYKPSHLHLQIQPPHRITHSTWINTSPKHLNQHSFTKIVSPKACNVTSPLLCRNQTRVIELGGSKEKRESRETNNSANEPQLTKTQLSSNETLNRRVAMLESRVKELHLQKQQLAIDLSQKTKSLQSENQSLKSLLKEYETKRNTPVAADQEEFDLQEMMSSQINLNLELREEVESLKKEIQQLSQNYTAQHQEFNTVSDQNADLKLQLLQLQDSSQDQVATLREEVATLSQNLENQQTSTTKLIKERQRRIFQLEGEHFSLSTKLEQEQQQKQALAGQLASLNAQLSSQRQELKGLRCRVQELEKPVECKKCKQLLHTVFRLNSQLNRK